jgi:hypothetical protein
MRCPQAPIYTECRLGAAKRRYIVGRGVSPGTTGCRAESPEGAAHGEEAVNHQPNRFGSMGVMGSPRAPAR